MYEAFDQFLAHDTWHTTHDLDGRRFYEALAKVVTDEVFNPDALGDYIRTKRNLEHENPYAEDIDRYVTAAWTVRDYLAVAG